MKAKTISPIIQASDLLRIYELENLVLVDATSKENYAYKHLDKALFVDLNSDLSEIKNDPANGGRHPLPSIEKFISSLQKLGIDEKSHVVIYDDKNGANYAARFWWMLRAVGHQKVQVLNGGIQAAEKLGLPINNKPVQAKKTLLYPAKNWMLPQAEMREVEMHSEDPAYRVVDVREPARYRGEFEPIDLVAGHIPGALNVPLSSNMNVEGLFLSQQELKEQYQNLFKDVSPEDIIIHCGSGVTACHTILAMDYAGLAIPKLYVGSWSEWSRNKKRIDKSS